MSLAPSWVSNGKDQPQPNPCGDDVRQLRLVKRLKESPRHSQELAVWSTGAGAWGSSCSASGNPCPALLQLVSRSCATFMVLPTLRRSIGTAPARARRLAFGCMAAARQLGVDALRVSTPRLRPRRRHAPVVETHGWRHHASERLTWCPRAVSGPAARRQRARSSREISASSCRIQSSYQFPSSRLLPHTDG